MIYNFPFIRKPFVRFFSAGLFALPFLAISAFAADGAPPDFTHDGLVRVLNSKVSLAYIKPDLDLSGYSKVIVMQPYVAFSKDWLADYNGRVPVNEQITNAEMEMMVKGLRKSFADIFTEHLEQGGFPLVENAGDDVLFLRPAIVNIGVSVPDPYMTKVGSRTKRSSKSAGFMTFFIEIFDSVSMEILVRAGDHYDDYQDGTGLKIARNYITNARDSERVLRNWADILVRSLQDAKNLDMDDVQLAGSADLEN